VIETRDLTKRFGAFTAVNGLTLQIPAGSVFGFLGPNGSGKSTSVKMMTGLLRPDSGEVWIDGLSVREQPVEVKRRIGVVPDDLALFHSLTIEEHLLLCGPLYGLSETETARRAEDLLKYLDLWTTRGTYSENCSFGMSKKCALAMALVHNPKVLFLDEPFEGIDPSAARNIKDLIQTLAQKGVTIFLTSHILEIAERLIDRFAIIRDGQLVTQGVMADLDGSLEDLYFAHVQREERQGLEWLG
jgi:ABC-2 type transport system ATP-binding protein